MLSFSQAEEINAGSDPEEREKKNSHGAWKKKRERYRRGNVYFYYLISDLSINNYTCHQTAWLKPPSRQVPLDDAERIILAVSAQVLQSPFLHLLSSLCAFSKNILLVSFWNPQTTSLFFTYHRNWVIHFGCREEHGFYVLQPSVMQRNFILS